MIPFKKFSRLFFSLLIALALFAATLPQPAAAADDIPTVACQSKHRVAKNETVRQIAQQYDISVTQLARANNLEKPYRVDTNERLCIPYKYGVAPVSGKFAFTVRGDRLRITADDFDHANSFFIKVKATRDASASFTKLGILDVEKNKRDTTSFTLPKSLRDALQITVCMKHFYTNELTCYYVLRTN